MPTPVSKKEEKAKGSSADSKPAAARKDAT